MSVAEPGEVRTVHNMTEPLTIDDLRCRLKIGRTTAYKLTKTPGFPPPLPTSGQRHHWDPDAVEVFLASEPQRLSATTAENNYIIETPEGITVYPPLRPTDGWRAQWYDLDGRRRACRATTEANLARKLEPIQARLAAAGRRDFNPAIAKQPTHPPIVVEQHPVPTALRRLPSHDDVAALATAITRKPTSPWWCELMPYLSAYSGLNLGELLVLDTDDITIGPQSGTIEAPWSERSAVYPTATPTGYPLAYGITRRVQEASAEKASGSNPRGLMFPTARGGYYRESTFIKRHAKPGYMAAGWCKDRGRPDPWTWHDVVAAFSP